MKLTLALRVLVVGVIGLVVLLALVLRTLAGAPPRDERSARSPEASGRLAAALLLEELGFEVRRFEAAPRGLPPDGGLLLVPAAPQLPAHLLIEPADERAPALDDPRHARHYRRFVERGGALVIAADAEARVFVGQALGMPEVPRVELLAPEPTTARVAGGSPLEITFPQRFVQPTGDAARVLVEDAAGLAVALLIERGAGRVVLLAASHFMTNEQLTQADHALLLVRLLEASAAPGERVHFDEFALGAWSPPSSLALALGPRARPVTLHLVLLALVWLWLHAFPREFPRDPAPLELSSPLERARAQAALLARARRHDLAADLLRAGVLRRLALRLRVVARSRWDGDEEAARRAALLAAVLERLPAELRPRARDLLELRDVTTAAGLEQLGQDLRELEALLAEDASPRVPAEVML